MENVPGFAAMQGGHSLITLLSQLENRGYKTFVKELKSWHYGVPQIRKRLFVTGLREPLRFQWPFPSTIKTTVQQAIGDLPIVGGGQRQEVLSYRQNGLSEFADRMRSSLDASEIGIIRDHVTRYVRDDDAKIFAGMKPGQTYKDVPEHLRRYRADTFADKYNRLTWDGLSRTITAHIAKDGYWYIHPEQDRSLSIREAARIQTFPDSFRFAGTPSNRYRQIGNAVPPLLAEKVGVSIRQALTSNGTRGSTSECYDQGVRKGLEEWHRKMRRPYAWRSERDPWYILLAEICLRRTNADQVHGMFQSLKELAATPGEMLDKKEEVREAMSHLGIVGRVDDLIKAAEKITETYGGIVPSTYDELIHLPGVGDYIASAVLCFAFDQPTTLLDTNTRRFARRFAAKAKMAPWEQRIMLHSLAKPGVADASWNYALLDLGALVCKASGPNCAECPLRTFCSTGKTRTQDGS